MTSAAITAVWSASASVVLTVSGLLKRRAGTSFFAALTYARTVQVEGTDLPSENGTIVYGDQ